MDDGREIKREGNDEEEEYRCDGREERNLGMERMEKRFNKEGVEIRRKRGGGGGRKVKM